MSFLFSGGKGKSSIHAGFGIGAFYEGAHANAPSLKGDLKHACLKSCNRQQLTAGTHVHAEELTR